MFSTKLKLVYPEKNTTQRYTTSISLPYLQSNPLLVVRGIIALFTSKLHRSLQTLPFPCYHHQMTKDRAFHHYPLHLCPIIVHQGPPHSVFRVPLYPLGFLPDCNHNHLIPRFPDWHRHRPLGTSNRVVCVKLEAQWTLYY